MSGLFALPVSVLLGCQTPATKVELIDPVTQDSKIVRISGQVSRDKCAQDKAIPLAIYDLTKISSGEVIASKKSKPFILEKNQTSYSIEMEDDKNYRGLAICPNYAIDSNFSLDTDQCLGKYERKWMLIFSKKMPSDISLDLVVKDCAPDLQKPREAEVMGCG